MIQLPEINTVSIIIVNYNSHKDVVTAIRSILDNTKTPINIVIVDNNSDVTDQANLRMSLEGMFPEIIGSCYITELHGVSITVDRFYNKQYHNIKSLCILKSPHNGGFAYGNNLGILFGLEHLENEAFWLLNSDTVIAQSALESLISTISHDNKTGIAGSILLEFDKPNIVQSAGGVYKRAFGINCNFLAGSAINVLKDNKIIYNNVDYPIGASMLVKKDFIFDVGLMNEVFFLYFEELDWVTRGKKKGWRFKMAPDSLVWHKEGGTINAAVIRSKISDYFIFRARILYTQLYHRWFLPTVIISSTAAYFYNRFRRKQYDRLLFPFQFLADPNMSVQVIREKAKGEK